MKIHLLFSAFSSIQTSLLLLNDGVTGIFQWHNPSECAMALGLTQRLIEMSTRDISWVISVRCSGLSTLPPSCADCLEVLRASTSWSPKGLSWPVMGWLLKLHGAESFLRS
jgi:hypothetical protein